MTSPLLILSKFNRSSTFWFLPSNYVNAFLNFLNKEQDLSHYFVHFLLGRNSWLNCWQDIIFYLGDINIKGHLDFNHIFIYVILASTIKTFQRNAGPWNHIFTLLFCFIFKSLEKSSAAFPIVGIYCPYKILELLFIWCIKFAAKILNCFIVLWVYPNTNLLSIQNPSSWISTSSSSFSWTAIFIATVAAVGPSLGMEINFKDAILDLAITWLQNIWP